MNSDTKIHFSTHKMAVCAMLIANSAVFLFFSVHGILDGAPLLKFWLPLTAFILLEVYVGVDEYNKLDVMTTMLKRKEQRMAIVFFLMSLFLIVTRNWNEYKLGMTDAFILCVLIGCIKDSILQVLAPQKFADISDVAGEY